LKEFSLFKQLHVDDTDVASSLTDNTTIEYIETAVKPETVVISIDKKALEIPTGN